MTEVSHQHVLVIDANAHIRRLIGTLLRAVSVGEVTEARSPGAAGAAILAKTPDLVIMDFTGDTTESVLFAHRLRRGEFGDAGIPVLAMGASTHHAVLEEAWAVGIDEVIAKPLSAIEMIERAASLLNARRAAVARLSPQSQSAAAE